jgi:thioesterase domain-containing protein
MWRSLLKVDSVGIRDNFFELGGGSLIAAQLCRRIERTFRKTVSLASVFEGPTVEQLAQLVACDTPADRSVKIVPLQPKGSNPPFFCVCMFVGSGPIFLPLTRYLGDEQPFLGLVPENTLVNDLPQPYALTDVAQHIVRAIRAYQPSGPYFMGGFCGDGVLAFEAARLLRGEGEEVALLALFEAQTRDMQKEFQGKKTQLRSIGQRFSPRQVRRHLANLMRSGMKGAPDYLLRRLHDLNVDLTDIRWQASIDWNLRLHGKLNAIKQVLFVAESTYTPPSYSGDVVVFRCRDYRVRSEEDRYGGWRQAVAGSIQLCEINGDHLGILNEPNVKTLAHMLSQCLEEARPDAAAALLGLRPTSRRGESDLSSRETVSSG